MKCGGFTNGMAMKLDIYIYSYQALLLSNRISVIHGSRINWETLCCPQFRTYCYQILCHVGGTSPRPSSLPHDTKFGNCRCEMVGRRVIFIWSLIHGSSWSGLIKREPGLCAVPNHYNHRPDLLSSIFSRLGPRILQNTFLYIAFFSAIFNMASHPSRASMVVKPKSRS